MKDFDEKQFWKEMELARTAVLFSIGLGIVNFLVLLSMIYAFGKVVK
jgi:hypothetical protein